MEPAPAQVTPAAHTAVTTLLLTDLVGSTKLVEELGDSRAAAVFGAADRLARALLREHHGQEIDKTDGFLFLFGRPVDAVLFALAYHDGLAAVSEREGVDLRARAGIHLGELVVIENSPEDVARGAKPVEVEGIAKPLAARIMSLAQGGQTLMTSTAFDLARRAVVGSAGAPPGTAWRAHGAYMLKGCEDPVEVFEVGVEGVAPLSAPPDTEKAKRSVAAGEEETLGWRPAANQPVPLRHGWVLDQKLGEGGFGEVWLAVNKATQGRRVFKFCFDAVRMRSLKRELTLFRLMRDSLGDRKDIARLFEVQLEEPPYFLESEFTPDGSLVEWAEARGGLDQVPLETRIDLVARTARAVAAAHSVGIVHKDIKPGNVLIYEEDGEPRPRLADFGIGTLADPEDMAGRNITIAGFTPATDAGGTTTTQMYAPPELLAGKPFTVLGDVYALGVMLYQMVVGDLARPLAQGWERDVPMPLLRDDIAVCVEGRDVDRLGSAQGLAKLLERLPARRRAYRRRRVARAALAMVSLVAGLGVLAGVWGFRESSLRHDKEIEAEKAKRVQQVLQDVLASADALDNVGRDAKVIDVLGAAEKEFATRLDDQPEVKAALYYTLGRTYRKLKAFDRAGPLLETAYALRREYLTPPNEELARTIDERAELAYDNDENERAGRLYQAAFDMRLALVEREPTAAARLDLAESYQHLAALTNNRLGDPVAAEPLYRKALEIREELLPADHRDTLRSRGNLGFCLMTQGKYRDADRYLADTLAAMRTLHADDPDHLEIGVAAGNLGRCLMELGRYDEARMLLEEAVRIKDAKREEVSKAVSLYYLGDALNRDGRHADAERALREAREIQTRFNLDRRLARTESLLGACLIALDRDDEAETLLLGAMKVLEDKHDAAVAATAERLARLYRKLGREEEARKYSGWSP